MDDKSRRPEPLPDAGASPRDHDPDGPSETILRDERQTERQAPENASPGETAGG